jgi:PAS domain S-box-containing protein
MPKKPKIAVATPRRVDEMQARLEELEETLRAIRHGEVDALVVSAPEGDRVFTLQGADHPYRVIVETINEGAATLSAEGLILYANRRLAEMVEVPLEKLIGSKLRDVVPILEWSTFDELLARAQTTPQKEEGYMLATGGKLVPVYLSLSPLRRAEFQGICVLVSDITEQKTRREQLGLTNELLKAEIAERERIEEALRQSEQAFRSFMNHTPAAVLIKDDQGNCVFRNKKAEALVGIRAQDPVSNQPLDWVPGDEGRLMHERDLAALRGGKPIEMIETICSPNGMPSQLLMVRFPFQDSSGRRLLGTVGVDITPQRRAEAALSRLTGRLLNLQDEERRRIARDLHDSTAQILTALALSVASLQSDKANMGTPRGQKLLDDIAKLAQDASNEIRNLSHLLHPPDLDSVGLVAAIQWHCRQVREMTGIRITSEFPARLDRLPHDIEIALFRIVQESLENVRRHSGSMVASVRLVQRKEGIVLEIKDRGSGMPPGILSAGEHNAVRVGVGVAGMRERVRQLGGELDISSCERGTTVTATVPMPKTTSQLAGERQAVYRRAPARSRIRVSVE